MVTVYDVAKASGLSIASVSRALNKQPGVSSATAERIVKIADTMGYQPNEIARSLVAKSTKTIALLLPDVSNPFFPELVKGVQARADEDDFVLFLVDGAGDRDRVAASMQVLRRKQVDGVIVVAGALAVDADDLFFGAPTVFLDRDGPTGGASVAVNHELGAYQATQYLIELGHKRIAHISGPFDLEVSQKRLAGWHRACVEAGIRADLLVQGDFTEEGGHKAGRLLVGGNKKPTAVFAANDLAAIGFMSWCAENKILVPAEISVVGFDGINLSRYTTPKLTTVEQPILDLGRKAASLLLELVQGQQSGQQIVLLTHLTIRESATIPNSGEPK